MPGVARPLLRRLGRDERGVVGVLVALLLGSGVLMGLGALVIDVSQLYQERAELQNGADAAALAVAKSCATGICTPAVAAQYANENASALTGHTAAVSQVCGSSILLGAACPASTGALTDCPSAPALAANGLGWVDVHTSTKLSNGSTLLPPVFAKTLLGNGSYQGSTAQACAQAFWGAATAANTVAFTISACSWDSWTSLGTDFAPPPPSVPAITYDHQLLLSNLGNAAGCSGQEASGSDGAGAFGWAKDQTGTCGIFTNASTFPVATGANAGSTCQAAVQAAWASRNVIFLPVYTTATGTGNNGVFALKGFAAFVVTGFTLPSLSEPDWLNPAIATCSKCIDGYFTKALITSGANAAGGGQYLGVEVIGLSG